MKDASARESGFDWRHKMNLEKKRKKEILKAKEERKYKECLEACLHNYEKMKSFLR
jgi:hypothetical protein